MIEDMLARLLAVVAVAGALTMPAVELVKLQGLPARFAPVASVVCGLVITGLLVLAGAASLNLYQAIFAGLFAGMSAAGVYSGSKAVIGRS